MRKSEIRERRALSLRALLWQLPAAAASGPAMKRFLVLIPLLALAVPAAAVPGGEIGTLDQGRYTCEMPGDASGPAGRHVPGADFTVISASSYRAGGRLGSYLLTGDSVVMTSGPHKGRKFHRLSRKFLRQVEADGGNGQLRCVLGRPRTRSSSTPPL